MSTGAAGHISQSTRNIINITSSRMPFVNLSTHTTPIIAAAAATATTILSSAATLASTNGSSSVFQQRLSQIPTGTTLPPRQLTTIPTQPGRTTTTIIMNSKRPTIIIYPTVSPESIVIPIVSCILGFPLLALLVICCLRRRAKLARERDRRRNYDMQDHAVSLVRFSPIHRLNNRSARVISLRPERSLSRGFPSLELDTVIEERSDPEQTQTDILSPESPLDPQKYRDFNSS